MSFSVVSEELSLAIPASPAAPDLPPEVAAMAGVEAAAPILEVCLRVTGMGYGVIAHVTEDRWLACAVLDEIGFGLPPGGELPIKSTLCNEVRQRNATIAFDHASADPAWRDHHTPVAYGLESYIAVPIVLADGEFFGTLCAIDPKPAPASKASTIKMFELFAQLIAAQMSSQRALDRSQVALVDAQATAELRDQFIAVLGHDLRNPLASIEAAATLLERRPNSDRAPLILAEMRQATRRMSRLINDVLDFARGRLGGGLTALRRPAEISTVLLQLIRELQLTHPDRMIETVFALDRPVNCDADRLAQLTSNLLSNALTHGDPAQPVRLSAVAEGDVFHLTVQNGGTLSDEVQDRLFQPFSRAHTGEVRDGLGLGLYIARQIAGAHRGALTARSEDGQTWFELRMPME